VTTRKPVVAAAVFGVAVVAAVVQYAVPSVVPVLERDPSTSGQWWRLATPLLVQTLGWYQVVMNLVTLALVGVVAERLVGRWRWAVLFVAGTVGGQIAAYAWREPGGGDSIAICGLAGGVLVWLLVHRREEHPWALWVVVGYVAALAGWGFGGVPGTAVAVPAAVVVLWLAPTRVVLVGTVGCCVVLALAGDLHGVSLVSGLAAGLAVTLPRR